MIKKISVILIPYTYKSPFIANDSLILNGGCLREKMFISMHIK